MPRQGAHGSLYLGFAFFTGGACAGWTQLAACVTPGSSFDPLGSDAALHRKGGGDSSPGSKKQQIEAVPQPQQGFSASSSPGQSWASSRGRGEAKTCSAALVLTARETRLAGTSLIAPALPRQGQKIILKQ